MSTKYLITAEIYDRKGNLLSVGRNSYTLPSARRLPEAIKTHPLQKRYAIKANQPQKQYLHAEIAALIKCRSLDAYKIVIKRVDKNGNTRLAAPCEVCQLAIKEAGIKVIEYTL